MAQYLFVVTRNLDTDVTARYVLRSALTLRRRAHDVTVFLADEAVRAFTINCAGVLGPLLAAEARVLAEAAAVNRERTIPRSLGIPAASDKELAGLMLTPGMQAHWC
jgi:hypothetical protein